MLVGIGSSPDALPRTMRGIFPIASRGLRIGDRELPSLVRLEFVA
jgi:hypothetical protein